MDVYIPTFDAIPLMFDNTPTDYDPTPSYDPGPSYDPSPSFDSGFDGGSSGGGGGGSDW